MLVSNMHGRLSRIGGSVLTSQEGEWTLTVNKGEVIGGNRVGRSDDINWLTGNKSGRSSKTLDALVNK
jgi:hypothetical protein